MGRALGFPVTVRAGKFSRHHPGKVASLPRQKEGDGMHFIQQHGALPVAEGTRTDRGGAGFRPLRWRDVQD